ncbi:class I SAM-dependent methyltransferase [Cohnella zeiphila]|uniref:Methyltransferase domain-containing protein n=1 Tax=Cohnella zeiphila TaxID=2761120 RepID=A0A7X0SIA1_9BACL|nr:methyltransferase domain-containing protein [Cohnella zeiphila]MBB6730498.1 methyltransferase domain-containing protein [Cohnella zeiphila]
MAGKKERGNYGIDAPNVVRSLCAIGAILIAAAAAALDLLNGVWLKALSVWGGAIGVLCWAEAAWMLWSSKRGKRKVVRKLIEALRLSPDDSVLDVGCGRGMVLTGVAKRLIGGKAVGIDIWNANDQSGNSPGATMRNAAAEGVSDRIQVVNADARRLPFEDGAFDAVASSLAIHNISERRERRKAIKEIVRVTGPNGRIALLDFRNVREYAEAMSEAGLAEVRVSGLHFSMFPPVRIVTGTKS